MWGGEGGHCSSTILCLRISLLVTVTSKNLFRKNLFRHSIIYLQFSFYWPGRGEQRAGGEEARRQLRVSLRSWFCCGPVPSSEEGRSSRCPCAHQGGCLAWVRVRRALPELSCVVRLCAAKRVRTARERRSAMRCCCVSEGWGPSGL